MGATSMADFKGYREASRTNWGTSDGEHRLSLDQINCGALLRIADATELMAKRHSELIAQKESAQRSAAYYEDLYRRCDRRLSAAKGQITKLKKALAGSAAS